MSFQRATAADSPCVASRSHCAACASPAQYQQQLPVLDLRRFRDESTRAAFVCELCDAFSQYGFLYLVGHGVRDSVRTRAMQSASDFFALPAGEKESVDSSLSPHVRGYSQLGCERTVGVVDAREVWEMGPDASALSAATLADKPMFMRLQGPNLWPSKPAGFKDAMTQLFRGFGDVCGELMQAVAVGLGQHPQSFEDVGYFADTNTAMKLKCCNYPTTAAAAAADSGNVEAESFGVGPHKDYGFLAVIEQSQAGLEVLDRAGHWQSVPLVAGALVVNGGELLELASGGAFMAATHRVIATAGAPHDSRVSIGFFHNPSFHAIVKQVPALPASMATAAAANRAVRKAAAAAGEGRDLYSEEARPYGHNALNGYMRSLASIFERRHPDLRSSKPRL